MPADLSQKYFRDLKIWDSCARTYEEYISKGHPDIQAYKDFEERLIDRILAHIISTNNRRVTLYDVGCGSGRLHYRYGLKTAKDNDFSVSDFAKIRTQREMNSDLEFDGKLAEYLHSVGGIDISPEMMRIARIKLDSAGISSKISEMLSFDCGSAFDLGHMEDDPLPIVVNLCNSIGVMQGPRGAIELFRTLRRMVEHAGGIALISAYRQDALADYGLNFYESTMQVSGQPVWLSPETYGHSGYRLEPLEMKLALDRNPAITVDIYDANGLLVDKDFLLSRDVRKTRDIIDSGHVLTYSGYQSHWYGFEQMKNWIKTYWTSHDSRHIDGKHHYDKSIAPAQFAIFDPRGLLDGLIERF